MRKSTDNSGADALDFDSGVGTPTPPPVKNTQIKSPTPPPVKLAEGSAPQHQDSKSIKRKKRPKPISLGIPAQASAAALAPVSAPAPAPAPEGDRIRRSSQANPFSPLAQRAFNVFIGAGGKSSFNKRRSLGAGAFGDVSVFEIKDEIGGEVAIKAVQYGDSEYEILKLVNQDRFHPNIIKTSYSRRPSPTSFFLPLYAGSLGKYLSAINKIKDAVEHKQTVQWFSYQLLKQVASGLTHFHNNVFDDSSVAYQCEPGDYTGLDQPFKLTCEPGPIIHHDIKSDNILLEIKQEGDDRDMVFVIADFGSALTAGMTTLNPYAGTVKYFAPEKMILEERRRNGRLDGDVQFKDSDICKIDVWSLGVVLRESLGMPKVYDEKNDIFAWAMWATSYLKGSFEAQEASLKRLEDGLYEGDDKSTQILEDFAQAMALSVETRPTSAELLELCQKYEKDFEVTQEQKNGFIKVLEGDAKEVQASVAPGIGQ